MSIVSGLCVDGSGEGDDLVDEEELLRAGIDGGAQGVGWFLPVVLDALGLTSSSNGRALPLLGESAARAAGLLHSLASRRNVQLSGVRSLSRMETAQLPARS